MTSIKYNAPADLVHELRMRRQVQRKMDMEIVRRCIIAGAHTLRTKWGWSDDEMAQWAMETSQLLVELWTSDEEE